MNRFRIIPVIDILNSQAVHAIKGERENYKPLKSVLINDSNPIRIALKLKNEYLFNEFYIADLDAILQRKPNITILSKILDIPGVEIIIDPGIKTNKNIETYCRLNLKSLVLGLETLRDLKVITECLKLFDTNKIVVSIDMYNEVILTNIKEIRNQNILEIVPKIEDLGVNNIILLDLFKVGQKMGGIPALYLKIREVFNGEILVGGGIKDIQDIKEYKSNNFSGVLIGTALHDGSIKIEELRSFLKS
ncbi:MAG TPA: HisA/HisF-related TIM barrel protein [Candidatus Nanopelagicaceae bacterium]|jgi:phosphoribosylformimino-5-aminoimidazole carboxamide ribotide isomerase|nr:HisA/HisF-related TIM barrel protein [Candidatus Nanopelagicaceae bacterium]